MLCIVVVKVYVFLYSDYATRNVIVAGLDEYWNYTTHVGTIVKSTNYLYYTPAANVAWTLTEQDGKPVLVAHCALKF